MRYAASNNGPTFYVNKYCAAVTNVKLHISAGANAVEAMSTTINLFIAKRYTQQLEKRYWRHKIYHTLNSDANEIRILKLLPNEFLEEDPVCIIDTISLNDDPKFAALSYAWGDQNNPRYITLNGCRVAIGTNLHTALRYVRRSDGVVPIWVDALCINQRDVKERNEQVLLMRTIFSKARLVYLWQGEANEHTADAIRIIYGFYLWTSMNKVPGTRVGFSSKLAELLPVARLLLRYCTDIARSSFWKRLWIVQEAILSYKKGSGYLLMGRHILWIPIYMQSVKSLMAFSEIENPLNYIPALEAIDHLFHVYYLEQLALRVPEAHAPGHEHDIEQWHYNRNERNESLNLEPLFWLNARLEVTDPRDRVYGVRALLPPVSIEPDYESGVSDVYKDATFRIMQCSKSLDPLRYIDLGHDIRSGMPMWDAYVGFLLATSAVSYIR